jgi:Protein of unknown function (DUF3500)
MKQEQTAFSLILKSLNNDELAKAKLNKTYSDLLAGPQKDNSFPNTPSGLKIGSISQEKQAVIINAIETYI